MTSVGVASLVEYGRLLESSEREAFALLERITIKVSRFYRNRAAFELIRTRLLPALASRGERLRVWSAGCGRGEEAWSLAMLLEDARLEGTVHASDVDPAALAAARTGLYPAPAAEELPAALRERYLRPASEGRRAAYRVADELRTRVRFAQEDLAAPPARGRRFDLVCCRNVLIYWQPAMQARMLAALVEACVPDGYLCLGEAEWPHGPAAERLEAVDDSRRIFRVPANDKLGEEP